MHFVERRAIVFLIIDIKSKTNEYKQTYRILAENWNQTND
jgi:hypothetical protein